MIELIAVTALFSAINFSVMKGVVHEYERVVSKDESTVVQIIECDEQENCESSAESSE